MEAKEDIEITMSDMMDNELQSFKNKNKNYNITFDKDGKKISVYYTSERQNQLQMTTFELRAMSYAMVIQGIHENLNWHLTINYYDYQTKTLLESKVIR